MLGKEEKVINLKQIDVKNLLRRYEDENLSYNDGEQFKLDEQDEKIWSYALRDGEEECFVIFQIVLLGEEYFISYSSDIKNEELRKKASRMAHQLKIELLKRKSVTINLEAPIIYDLKKYNELWDLEKNPAYMSKIKTLASEYLCKEDESKKDNRERYLLYGLEGFFLGTFLGDCGYGVFTESNDGEHHIDVNMKSNNELLTNAFVLSMRNEGFLIAKEEDFANRQIDSLVELIDFGLVEINKKPLN